MNTYFFLLLVTYVDGFTFQNFISNVHHEQQQQQQPNLKHSIGLSRPSLLSSSSSSSTTWPSKLSAASVSTASSTPSSSFKVPSWKEILEIPVKVNTKEDFEAIPLAKRIAIVSRVSVLHLTLLSCLGPLILRGAVRAAATASESIQQQVVVSPLPALLFTIQTLSYHAVHNLLNDWQDLNDDDSEVESSFRLRYGVHALQQGFMSKVAFLKLMAGTAVPGVLLSALFFLTGSPVAPASVYGLLALYFYTIVFKPIALGEALIYLVWGPLMAGYGTIAAGAAAAATPMTAASSLLTDPVGALMGLTALTVIMGKHTDKINTSKKRTLPKLLGFPAALFACGATILAPHVVLFTTLLRERILLPQAAGTAASVVPTLPLGSALAFLTLFREVPACLRILRKGPPQNNEPTLPRGTILKGTVWPNNIDRAWPLWFVAFLGWHAITFAYLLVIGSGLEWAVRAALLRL